MRATLAFVVVVLAVTAASAQTGGISVIVTDTDGVPLPGATVTLSHETGFVKTSAELTNEFGIAAFPILRPGAGYTIEVAFPGYNTIRQDELRIRINDKLSIPVQMMTTFQERVKVTAKSEVIDMTTTRQSTKFSEDFISDLPVPGRFYQNVLTMAPGVQDADGDGNPNVHGSRSRDFQAIVSGVSNVDPLTGRWMSRINPNSIEEMEVITAGAGVEFGRAQGGFARIIQKQGSNRHEGVAEFYYRSSKLDGNGAFDGSGIADAEFDWYQPAVQFSGPLIRDKLWYRISAEYRDIEIPINVTTGIEITTVEDYTNDFQVTWQISPRNKLAVQYRQDPRTVSNLGISTLVDSRSSFGFDRETQTTSLIWTAPYSPKVLVESTVSWQDQNLSIFPTTAGQMNDCVVGRDFLESARCFNSTTGQVTGSYNVDQSDHRQRLSVKGKATFYGGKFWGMSHRFKLGIASENERYFRNLTRRPTLAYFVINNPGDDTSGTGGTQIEKFAIAVTNLAVPQTDNVRSSGANWAFYGEDQFTPRRNLTVTVGARVDREEIDAEGRQLFDPTSEMANYLDAVEPYRNPDSSTYNPTALPEIRLNAASAAFTGFEEFSSFESQMANLLCGPGEALCRHDTQISIESLASIHKSLHNTRENENINIENTNVSPYLAVAWDPYSNGKMAIKASVGRHYNNIPLIVPLQELEPSDITLLYRVELDGEDAGLTRLLNGISPSVNVSMLDPELNTPYQDEYTISFEHELWAETSISATYVNRQYRDQLQDRNINVGTGDYGRCLLQQTTTDPALGESWGSGFEVTDPHTLQTYVDTDPGPGDGVVDDCIGDAVELQEINEAGILTVGVVQRPDEILDLYKLNPFWGDIFVIGNYNEIDYEAVVIELVRRQYRSWELQGSYTYSTAEGDGEDFNQGFDDDPSVLQEDLRGFQSYDQRHVVKVNATTITPWGIRLGTAVSWQSGLPYSIIYRQPSFDALPPATSTMGITGSRSRITYPTGVRNDQRNESYWNIDIKATKEFRVGQGFNMQLTAEVYNVLDNGTYQVYNPDLERGIQVNGANEARRLFGRQWQLGLKVAF